MSKIKLDLKERLFLANQYEVLKHVDPGNAAEYEKAQEIVRGGFEIGYSLLVGSLDEEGMRYENGKRVHDILDMYRRLKRSFEELADKSGINPKDIEFMGFDGNNEPSELSYAEHLKRTGRWEEIEIKDSHMPSLGIYCRMLDEEAKYRGQFSFTPMTKEQIRAVLAARIPVERRQQ